MHLSSTQSVVPCPICSQPTQRVHSRYERTLADLPCTDFKLVLILQVRKFFCMNDECYRRIFTERLPRFALPWARKTERFVNQIRSIALSLGGAAGARLGYLLGYDSCGSTLLSHLQRLALPKFAAPSVVGVDNFAFRKGHEYGTIIVNLETHRPIAILADRKADTLSEWLQTHPGIEFLSRDRSKTYKKAMTQGVPEAIQVADRFHLVQNLSEVLERVLGSYRSELKQVEKAQQKAVLAAATEKTVIAKPKPTATQRAERQILSNQKRRIKQQRLIKEMQAQQCSNSKFQHTDIDVSAKVAGEPRWGEAGECYDVSRLERRRRIAFFGGAGANMNASRAFQLSKYRYLVSAKISWKKPCRVPRMCRIA
ncbi:MAG: ISL3 family transposase [Phormidesmis sp.]